MTVVPLSSAVRSSGLNMQPEAASAQPWPGPLGPAVQADLRFRQHLRAVAKLQGGPRCPLDPAETCPRDAKGGARGLTSPCLSSRLSLLPQAPPERVPESSGICLALPRSWVPGPVAGWQAVPVAACVCRSPCSRGLCRVPAGMHGAEVWDPLT